MSTQPARGMRDFLPDDIRRREFVVGVIRDVYERYGFEPLETPAVENIETLLGKYGEEGNKLIFKILKRGEHASTGEADLALRYDLTVPLARVVAEHQAKLPKLFKRYQIQPVWRADRPARGRYREFYQCDIDAIGSASLMVEAELLAAVGEVMARLGFDDFVVRLNHRRLLTALLDVNGVPEALHNAALVTIDKLDKVQTGGVIAELTARGISGVAANRLLAAFSGQGDPFGRLEPQLEGHEAGTAGLSDLRRVLRLTEGTSVGGKIRVDPSLARGLSYYTGAIMEIAVPDLAGSLGGGGRYDNLIGMFLGREIPACGFSLGLERIIVVMTERQMFPSGVSGAGVDVVVAFLNDDLQSDALMLAADLRAEKLRVDVYPESSRKFDKVLKYASGRDVPMMAILGEDERARGDVTVRDLRTRQQQSVERVAVANWITDHLRAANTPAP